MRARALLLLTSACLGSAADSDRARFRQALAQSPVLANPASAGRVDHTPSGSWDSSFRLISYSAERACFLAEWNVPASIAPGLSFKLAGWPTLDAGETAPRIKSESVEVLDSATLATVKHYDAFVGPENAHHERAVLVSERPDQEQAMYQTSMRVCFVAPASVLEHAQYAVISVEADEHHRTGAGWHLIPR